MDVFSGTLWQEKENHSNNGGLLTDWVSELPNLNIKIRD